MAPKQSVPVVEEGEEVATASAGYPPAELPEVASEASSASEDEASSDEETDEEDDNKSTEGQEKQDSDKDPDPSGDGSGSTTEVASSSADPLIFVEEFIDAEFQEEMNKTTDINELNKLHQQALQKATFFWKCKVALNKKLIKAINTKKKEEKKKREEQEKEAKKEEKKKTVMLTLNIIITGETYTISLPTTATSKDIRDSLRANFPKFKAKFLKELDYLVAGEMSMKEHARRTLAGWGIKDGAVIKTRAPIVGGGKRARSTPTTSKDEKINAKQLQLQMATAHVLNLGIPDLSLNKQFIQQVTELLISANGIDNVIANLSVEKCKKIQAFIFATNNEASRIDFISKVCYSEFFERIDQTIALTDLFNETARAMTTYAIYKGYLTETSRMSWEGFRMTLEKIIERKQLEGASAAGTF